MKERKSRVSNIPDTASCNAARTPPTSAARLAQALKAERRFELDKPAPERQEFVQPLNQHRRLPQELGSAGDDQERAEQHHRSHDSPREDEHGEPACPGPCAHQGAHQGVDQDR